MFMFLFSDWIDSNRLMGKVASDKCHKWVFKEPTECEPNISNYWQSSFDAVWTKEDSTKLVCYEFLISILICSSSLISKL